MVLFRVGRPAPTRKVLFTGNSLVQGLCEDCSVELLAWAATHNVVFVGPQDASGLAHNGHSGWTMGQMQSQMPDVLTTYTPDIVLFEGGTNDGLNNSTAPYLASYRGQQDDLAETVWASRAAAAVVLITMFPNNVSGFKEARPAYAAELADLVSDKQALGKRIVLCDTNTDAEPFNPSDYIDDTHPNAAFNLSYFFVKATAAILAAKATL